MWLMSIWKKPFSKNTAAAAPAAAKWFAAATRRRNRRRGQEEPWKASRFLFSLPFSFTLNMTFRLSEFGLPMLAKDLVEMAQRRRTYAVRVAFALLVFSMSAVLMLPVYGWAKGSPIGMLGRGSMLLYALYVIEWLGLCLFVPAVVSGALADEKERNTLQLLFLTRLGPWTILLEKLLSRLVSV